jgi:hypothetical protein
MSDLIFNRLVAIIENGTYPVSGTPTGLGATALRTMADSLDLIPMPCVLILPRGDSGWQIEAGASYYTTTFSYDLYFYVREVGSPASNEVGLADVVNLSMRAAQIFLSRPQLELAPKATYADIPQIYSRITWQTTSSLNNPITYPFQQVTSQDGAKFYWGFVIRLTVPYHDLITYNP